MNRAGVCGMIQPVNDIGESLSGAVALMASYHHICNVFKERVFQATCAEDLETAHTTGRTGVLFSLTGLPIAGAGCMDDLEGICTETNDGGVSDLGRELVRRMNRTGIVIDLPPTAAGKRLSMRRPFRKSRWLPSF